MDHICTHLDVTWFPWNSPRNSLTMRYLLEFSATSHVTSFFGRPDELSITYFTGNGKGLYHVPGFLQWLHHPQMWLSMPPSCRDELGLIQLIKGLREPMVKFIPKPPKWKECLHKLLVGGLGYVAGGRLEISSIYVYFECGSLPKNRIILTITVTGRGPHFRYTISFFTKSDLPSCHWNF